MRETTALWQRFIASLRRLAGIGGVVSRPRPRLELLALAAFSTVGFWLLLPEVPIAEGAVQTPECRPQKAKDFLKRPSFVRRGKLDGRGNERALKFRVEKYGRIEGDQYAEMNEKTARSQAVGTRFFGLPLSLHRSVVPALRCVERRIRKECKRPKDQYRPHAVGGFRDANSFRGGEVSNHLFGIAIDIDPDRNPCCGCVDPWPEHPACRAKVDSVLEQTALTSCWISAFERYGFYWLGRDPQLRDTMHFEFLGDPAKVMTTVR